MRTSWTSYFLNLAEIVATRSTCDRLHVGCVLVKNNRIISTGYNGSPSGEPHCDDVGHLMIDNHCVRTVHAEANAITQCAIHGVSTNKSIAYLTHTPCFNCAKLLISSGIRTVFIKNKYGEDTRQKLLFDSFTYEK